MFSTKANSDRGATMVEFSLVLPIIVLFVFGILQYGLVFGAYLDLRNAASAGARFAAFQDPTQTAVQDFVRGSLSNAHLISDSNAVNVTVAAVDADNDGGGDDSYQVTVTYDLDLFFPFLVPGHVGGDLPFSMVAFHPIMNF